MKLTNFNEAFERMGNTVLNEEEISAQRKKELLNSRLENLSKLKEMTLKALQSTDLSNDIEKFKNYVTVLDWIGKLIQSFKDILNANYKEFSTKLKYSDHYIKQIASALNSGQRVHESLLKESLNYICKNN